MVARRILLAAVPLIAAVSLGACSSSSNDATDTVSPLTIAAVSGESAAPESGGFNDADITFTQGMIPHHQQAVEMATVALDATRKAGGDVTRLAAKIQDVQDPEITVMNGWLESWGQPTAMSTDMGGMDGSAMTGEGMMTAEEMSALKSASGPAFDKMWMEMMIRHHEGAVAMSKTEQADGSSPEAVALAQQIITAQESEIAEMKALLAA